MLVRLLELSWWFHIHEKKQLHEVIDTPSETPNRHRCSSNTSSRNLHQISNQSNSFEVFADPYG